MSVFVFSFLFSFFLFSVVVAGVGSNTLSAEIFFQRESSTFLFAFVALFMVLHGVFGSVGSCFVVTFYVVERHHLCC